MEVRLDDAFDAQPMLSCVGEVLLDVALWVDNDSSTARSVANEVGGMTEAAQVVLLEEHASNGTYIRSINQPIPQALRQ